MGEFEPVDDSHPQTLTDEVYETAKRGIMCCYSPELRDETMDEHDQRLADGRMALSELFHRKEELEEIVVQERKHFADAMRQDGGS